MFPCRARVCMKRSENDLANYIWRQRFEFGIEVLRMRFDLGHLSAVLLNPEDVSLEFGLERLTMQPMSMVQKWW